MASDALTTMGTCMFDDAVMAAKLPAAVVQRFNECLVSGAPTPEDDSGQRESFCNPFQLFLNFQFFRRPWNDQAGAACKYRLRGSRSGPSSEHRHLPLSGWMRHCRVSAATVGHATCETCSRQLGP